MSIIKSPYEISIWRDVLKDGVPKEQKVCVIGSDKMTSQSRAFLPNFVRNANGEKKLSFKMYKQYIDTISGEEVHNPFVDNLINETKVKLYYEDKWYDFIVKDINENSATHLCTYQLEDALVRELSKNGFGITLDAKLNNNLGDAKKLANDVLAETDWTADSEVFIEKVDEALVYVKLPAGTAAVHLLDQVKDEKGGYSTGVTEEPVNFESDTTVLAFYSSCKNKPYRFQFIYSDKGYDRAADGSYVISRKDTRTIDEKNCQYYIDIGDSYVEPNKDTGTAALELYLPEGWVIGDVGKRWDGDELLESDSTLSSWYRGDRYGYAQQTVYVPLLEKYCQKFKSAIDKEEYLGYTDSKFVSPTLIQNCINNYNFESKAGWVAVQSNNSEKPRVENVYGRFNNKKFSTVTDEFYNGSYDPKNKYKAYMKMSFNNANEFVLNSGIRDNRTMIGNMPEGEEWVLDCKIVDNLGRELTKDRNNKDVPIATQFTFSFDEYVYNSSTGLFSPIKDKKIVLKQLSDDPVSLSDNTVRIFFKVDSNQYTKKDFKNSKIYLKIKPPKTGDYYIENIALYKKSLDKGGGIITPDYESKNSVSAEYFIKTGVVENRYHFFKPELVIGDNAVKTAEEVKTTVLTKLDYTQFIPVFNEGAKKIRTVSAKESNYFNILQSIAETFEGWLDLEIKRDEYGGIEEKKVTFKNYLGETNYANFRYGVNLKEIQRTTNSKNIVSKLIVKQNSNELGQDGFCTIQRAGANPTGENYIYDFQYYHNQGLMDAAEYFGTIYYLTGAQGWDARLWNNEKAVAEGDFNLKGYALRVKKINDAMMPINQELVGLTQSLVDKQAKLEVAEATKEAAVSELAAIRSDFYTLFGIYPELISPEDIIGITDLVIEPEEYSDWWNKGALYSVTADRMVYGSINAIEKKKTDRTARFLLKLNLALSDNSIVSRTYKIKATVRANSSTVWFSQPIASIDLENSTVQKYLTSYTTCLEQEDNATKESNTLTADISQLEIAIKERETEFEKLKNCKQKLNELFFKKYGRFISEGTWISEEHTDDDKYYADAQSVLYNSCYPQVQYNINVLFLSKLPGYELFKFNLGDTTNVIDEKFFGKDKAQEVVITEISEQLDDPTQDTIKVQTFKNQFQDLFQKITATVQQTQYNVGSYEKGEKFLESSIAKKSAFLTNAINQAQDYLKYGQTVVSGKDGITITDDSNKQAQLRLVGGAILFSTTDPETQETTWRTGLTNEGISADLITAGQIDAGLIQIISGEGPTFRWDSYGISAFASEWVASEEIDTISGINTKQFVRFDKNGVYGINNVPGIDGTSWRPNDLADIKQNAFFALTWDGLFLKLGNAKYKAKVNGSEKIIQHIASTTLGKVDDNIYNSWTAQGIPVYDSAQEANPEFVKVFAVGTNNGGAYNEELVVYDDGTLAANKVRLTGSIQWTSASSPSKSVYSSQEREKPADGRLYNSFENDDDGTGIWHKNYNKEYDKFYAHTDDGGATWQGPMTMVGQKGSNGKGIKKITNWYYLTEKETATLPEAPKYRGGSWNTGSWSPITLIPTSEKRFLWNYEGIEYTEGNPELVGPVCIGVHGEQGDNGDGLQIQYQITDSQGKPSEGGWNTTYPENWTGLLWMRQKLSNTDNWSAPVQMSGSEGKPGKDGADVEYVYYRSESAVQSWEGKEPSDENIQDYPTETDISNIGDNWYPSPLGITSTWKYEYMSVRTKPSGIEQQFGPFSDPVIWSKWGEKGQDGDDIEYKYCRTGGEVPPYPTDSTQYEWTDDPSGVTAADGETHEYVIQIKVIHNEDGTTEEVSSGSPALWAKYGKDGKDAVAALAISLSNDKDLIPASSEGEVDENTALGGATTKITLYKNGEEDTSTDAKLDCVVTANGNVVDSSNYTFADKNFKLNKWGSDWNSAIATFTYQAQVLIDGTETPVKVEKNFVMTKIKTEPGKEAIDYYLELSQSSVNTTSKDGTIAVVAKKQVGTVISDITSDEGVEINCSSSSGWDNSAKEYEYSQGQTGEIIFTLFVNEQEWDRQTLLLTKDGSIEELPEALTKNDIYIYYRSKNDGYAANAPTLPSNSNEIASNENNDEWTTYNLDPLVAGWSYVYRAQCVETVSNNEIKYSNFRNRKLYKVYHETIDYQEYANYYTLVRGNSDGLAYDNGKLYINARGIEVRNNDNDILIQAIGIGNNRSVTVGGWKVSPQELRADNGEAVLSSGQDYSYNSLVTNQNSYLRLGLGKVVQPITEVQEEFSTEEFAFEGSLGRKADGTIEYGSNCILQAKIVYDISKRHGQFAVLDSSPNITVDITRFNASRLGLLEEVKDNTGRVIQIKYSKTQGAIYLEATGIPGTQQITLTLTYQMSSGDFSDEIEFWRYFTSHYTYFSLVGNIGYNIVEPDYRTRLLSDGSIYCSAVKLDGEVYAKKGQIGDFNIDKGRLLVNNSLSNSLLSYDYSAKSFTITGEAGTLVTDMKIQPFYEYSALGNGRVVVGNLLHRVDKSGWNNSGIALLNADADWPGLYGFSYYFEPASPSQEYDNEAVLPELLEATEFKNVDFKEKDCKWYFNGKTWSVKDASGNQRVITFDQLFQALQQLGIIK